MKVCKRAFSVLLVLIMCTSLLYNTTDVVQGEELSRMISDGTYRIQSAIDPGYCLDIYNANGEASKQGTNLQIYKGSQTFNITYLNNGYSKIASTIGGYALDVYNSEKTAGTNVIQYGYSGADNQQWLIKYVGDGYYSIVSKCNGLYLDVQGGSVYNRCNVDVYTGNNTLSQKWKLVPVFKGKRTIADGTYRIESSLDSSYCLDVYNKDNSAVSNGANVQIHNGTQTFKVSYQGNGYYKILSAFSGKAVDVYGDGLVRGTNVSQYSWKAVENQYWLIQDAGNGYYNIVSKASGLYLDIYGGKIYDECNVDVWPGNGHPCQKWKFVKTKTKKSQKVSGTSSFSKSYGSSSFSLKQKAKTKITYKSSDPSVVSVSSSGKATIKGCGQITVWAIANESSKYATKIKAITIKVRPRKISKISVSKEGTNNVITYSKTSPGTTYEIVLANNKKFKNAWKTTSTSSSFTADITSKRTYYVKIRGYVVSGEKVLYSSWYTKSFVSK